MLSPARGFARIRPLVVALGALVGAASVGPGSAAVAQPSASPGAPSSYLVVTTDRTPLRCGAGQTWYVVAELSVGTVLKVSGETDGFFQVEYPTGLPAVVKVIEGNWDSGSGTVTLTRRTPLMAFNALDASMENCYKRVFVDHPLEPGTQLKYIGPVEDRKGELAGYRVVAPAGARGYVLPTGVRPATPDEVVKAGGAPAVTTTPVVESPAPATDAGAPSPAVTEMKTGAVGPSAGNEPETAPAIEAKAPVSTDPNDALIDDLNRLEPAFQRVMRSDPEFAEFVDLLESYNAIAEKASVSTEGERVRQYADAKIALLQIRADLQAARAEFESAEASSAEAEADLVKLAQLAREARGYAVVGRLLTSAIYDGTGLPRMFRVQSLERGTSRTIAYVLPNEGLALDSLTGKIVGVRGESTVEATPRIPVVRASEVDVLTLEPAQAANAGDTSN